MKITIDEIQKMASEDNLAREKRHQAISEAESQIESLKAQLPELGRNGKTEEYKSTKQKIKDLEDDVEILKLQGTIPPFGKAEAAEAWQNYVKEYNKSFEKKVAEYDKAKSGLAQMYADLVKSQNEALKKRELLADLAGISPDDRSGWAGNVGVEYSLFPLRYLPESPVTSFPKNCRVETPELAFFVQSGLWTIGGGYPVAAGDAVDVLWRVVHRHESADDISL